MEAFRAKVWDYYRDNGRHDLPWRVDVSPYSILVSEVMLQQTQVSRVIEKYTQWMHTFADFQALAEASGAQVLAAWQGLGYNRRGLWLREAARMIIRDFDGVMPRDPSDLVKLPGVGPNTAGSIAAFAYNEPVVFIETNIRRVFIHEFFGDGKTRQLRSDVIFGQRTWGDELFVPEPLPALAEKMASSPRPRINVDSNDSSISDATLRPLIAEALTGQPPREWYWALMDYGSYLAKQGPNPNRRSQSYAKQSKFEGSARQIRGEVLRRLMQGSMAQSALGIDDARVSTVVEGLIQDGLIVRDGYLLSLPQ